MSAAWERAMGALEADPEADVKPLPPHSRAGKCWRCLKNSSRVPGEDFSCEPCHLWMTGESDEDPRDMPGTNSAARRPAVHGRWGFPTRLET